MANHPKRTVDPTEAALSAIQEALNVRDDEERPEAPAADVTTPPPQSPDALAQSEPATPAFDEAINLDDIARLDNLDDIGDRTAEAPPLRAANDDQQSIGRI